MNNTNNIKEVTEKLKVFERLAEDFKNAPRMTGEEAESLQKLLQKNSKEHKELHESIQMSDEMYRRRFTI